MAQRFPYNEKCRPKLDIYLKCQNYKPSFIMQSLAQDSFEVFALGKSSPITATMKKESII